MFIDLISDSFTAGRDVTNDLTLTSNQLKEEMLTRISKVHFVIYKDPADEDGPIYIEVIREYKKNQCDFTKYDSNTSGN